MTLTFDFLKPFRIQVESASPSALASINTQLESIATKMSELTDAIKVLTDTATAERAQVKAAFDDYKIKLQTALDGASGKLGDEDKAAFALAQGAIAGIYEPDAAAKTGVRVAVGFNSTGGEIVGSSTVYVDTPQTTADLLNERVAGPVAAAIAGAAPVGIPVAFDFFLNVDGANLTPESKGTDLAVLLAGQQAALTGLLGIVNDQIAALPAQ